MSKISLNTRINFYTRLLNAFLSLAEKDIIYGNVNEQSIMYYNVLYSSLRLADFGKAKKVNYL